MFNRKIEVTAHNRHKHGLNDRQNRFCIEYMVDFKPSHAAKRAGYQSKLLNAQANFLLNNPRVSKRIAELIKERDANTALTADKVMAGMANIAFADMRDIFDHNGNLRSIHEMPERLATAISSIEFVTTKRAGGDVEHVTKIKLPDRIKALELVGRQLGLFSSTLNVNARVDITTAEDDELKHRLEQLEAQWRAEGLDDGTITDVEAVEKSPKLPGKTRGVPPE